MKPPVSSLAPEGGRQPSRSLTRAEARRFERELIEELPRMRRFARALQRDRTAAEDVVQEAALRAWAARDRFTPGTNMGAWLFTILKRVYLSSLRSSRPTSDIDDIPEMRLSEPEAQTAVVLLREVNAAMDGLDNDQREALAMVTVEGRTYEEASLAIGVPIGTIKSRVARARQALVALFGNTNSGRSEAETRDEASPPQPDDPQLETIRLQWRAAKKLSLSFLIG